MEGRKVGEGKRVVPVEEHIAKIKAACEARGDSGMVIIGRTDSRAVLGLEEAVRRARLYYKAGADVVFVEATHSLQEMRYVSEKLAGVPLLSNYIEGGKTPVTNSAQLGQVGPNYKFLMFSVSGLLAATQALTDVYTYIHNFGTTHGYNPERLQNFQQFKKMIGLDVATQFTNRLEKESHLLLEEDRLEEEVKEKQEIAEVTCYANSLAKSLQTATATTSTSSPAMPQASTPTATTSSSTPSASTAAPTTSAATSSLQPDATADCFLSVHTSPATVRITSG